MRGHVYHHRQRVGRRKAVIQALPLFPSFDWHEPTLGEFVRQVEHGFGRHLDLSSLRHAGFSRDEPLDPDDIRELCDLLGLPPEDFGLS